MFLREVTIHIASRFNLIHSMKVASSSSSNESVPSVFYVTTGTTKYAVPYHPGITIRQVKALLEQSEDMNPDKIRFSIGLTNPRPVCQDDATLADYGIHPFDTLNQVTDCDGLQGGNRNDTTTDDPKQRKINSFFTSSAKRNTSSKINSSTREDDQRGHTSTSVQCNTRRVSHSPERNESNKEDVSASSVRCILRSILFRVRIVHYLLTRLSSL